MTKVDENRLKGNYGASIVTTMLSSKCLVRPVSADTDVGVDLYCETVTDGQPFLHFWVQVKAGAKQCKLSADGKFTCYFKRKHLVYWKNQPVPVFVALVPIETWPHQNQQDVYIINITKQILSGNKKSTLESDYMWHASGHNNEIQEFLDKIVPETTAHLQISKGLISEIPTLTKEYEQKLPEYLPVLKYKKEILTQIRRTAAFSMIYMQEQSDGVTEGSEARNILTGILKQFKNGDRHWETFMALAISYYHDEKYKNAILMYEKAKKCIAKDKKVCNKQAWIDEIGRIDKLIEDALKEESYSHFQGAPGATGPSC